MDFQIKNDLDVAKNEIQAELQKTGGARRPKLFTSTNINCYFNNFSDSMRLIKEEPEILFFVMIQWLTVLLGYILWTQLFKWIPPDVWDAISKSSDSENSAGMLDYLLLVWSLLVVILASYPIAICNAAIVAVHNLRACGEESTIYKALALGMRHVGRLWMFTSLDAWITINAIFDRLPSKKKRRTAMDELAYYAWKISTMTVVPSLVNGRGFIGAGKDAVDLFKKCPGQMLMLRMGYSAVCWIVGVLTYVLSLAYLCTLIRSFSHEPTMYIILLVIGLPIVIAAAVVMILLRPPFLLGVAKLYSDNLDVADQTKIKVTESPLDLLLEWKTILFFFLLCQILFVTFFAERIGFAQWVAKIARASVGL